MSAPCHRNARDGTRDARYIDVVDFSVAAIRGCPSTEVVLGLLVAILFPLIALPMALRARRLGFALMLVPLLVNAAVAFWTLRHVLEGLAITGSGSVAALSAGIASAQAPLITGSFAAALCAAIAAVAAWRRPSEQPSNRMVSAAVVTALLLAAIEPLFALVFARYVYDHLVVFWDAAGVVAVGLLAGGIAALFASRGGAVRPLLLTAASAAIVGAEAWLVLRHFEHIALFGH
jgi:hypothetical protein